MIKPRCICGKPLRETYRIAGGEAYVAECVACGKRYSELSLGRLEKYQAEA